MRTFVERGRTFAWGVFAAMLAVGSGFVVSCSDVDPEEEDNVFEPIELSSRTKSFVSEGNRFAFQLLQEVERQEGKSFMVSPLSLNLALGMLMESAPQCDDADKVMDMLGYPEGSREEIREYADLMMERLPRMDKKTTVSMAETGRWVAKNQWRTIPRLRSNLPSVARPWSLCLQRTPKIPKVNS